jgi:uroporphyrin-III C-methyltransferase
MTSALEALLRNGPRLLPGHVWLAGAGPGDPRCLTIEVVAALGQAEVLVHDALVDPAVLDLAPQAERIFAGKRGGRPSAEQADITAALILHAQRGRRVVRLKGGDPFVFGRGAEEAVALAEAGIPFRILPGLTAGLSGLAAASIPATMREVNHAVILATGHGAEDAEALDWAALARTGQPIVLYMATRTLPMIVAALRAGGMPPDTPAAFVMAATLPSQRVVVTTLARLVEDGAREGIGSPAVVAIGGIVAMRERLLGLAMSMAAQ